MRSVTAGSAALTSIDAKMRSEGGPEVAPDFGPLVTQFAKLNRLSARNSSPAGCLPAPRAVRGQRQTERLASGGARSRLARMPSARSTPWPTTSAATSRRVRFPLFVDRAKRLVAKDFLEVLADIAPDALAVARSAGGLKDQDQ